MKIKDGFCLAITLLFYFKEYRHVKQFIFYKKIVEIIVPPFSDNRHSRRGTC